MTFLEPEPRISLYKFNFEFGIFRVMVRYAEGPAEAIDMGEAEFIRLYGAYTALLVRDAGPEGFVTRERPRP